MTTSGIAARGFSDEWVLLVRKGAASFTQNDCKPDPDHDLKGVFVSGLPAASAERSMFMAAHQQLGMKVLLLVAYRLPVSQRLSADKYRHF